MSIIHAKFDGHAFVPDQPVNLPPGTHGEVEVTPSSEPATADSDHGPNQDDRGSSGQSNQDQDHVLMRLLEIAERAPVDPNAPTDMAAEHDHYLYGTPKKYS